MQLTFDISSHNQHCCAINGKVGQRSATKDNSPSEEIWVFSRFCQKLARKKLSATENFKAGNILSHQKQLNNKHTDPAIAFVKNERQI